MVNLAGWPAVGVSVRVDPVHHHENAVALVRLAAFTSNAFTSLGRAQSGPTIGAVVDAGGVVVVDGGGGGGVGLLTVIVAFPDIAVAP